jgi:ketosteroid isomerase-like protein
MDIQIQRPLAFSAAQVYLRLFLHISTGKKMKTTLAILAVVLTLSGAPVFASTDDEVKATFDRFVAAQNAHDISAVRDVLWDSMNFLWVTRGTPIWGRDAALKRFETLYQGTWKLSPDTSNLKVVSLSDTTAQLFVPIMFNIGPPGQPAPDAPFLMNQTLVKTAAGWRIASILPIPLPPPATAPAK